MAKKDNTHPILQEIKNTAKHLQSSAKAKGENLIYGHALDQASKQHGYKDWNTACGMAKNTQPKSITPSVTHMDASSYAVIEQGFNQMRGMNLAIYKSTQSLSDLDPASKPVSQKTFYTKRNRLMGEWENLLNDPHYEEIPYEIDSFEEMCSWVRDRGGVLFFPTNSAEDLRNLSEDQRGAIEANITTEFSTTKNSNEGKIYGMPMAGMETLLKSLSDDEIAQLVNMTLPIHSAISRGHRAYQNEMIEKTRMIRDEASKRGLSYVITYRDDERIGDKLIDKMHRAARKYSGQHSMKNSKTFVRSSNDKHAKAKFSARGR